MCVYFMCVYNPLSVALTECNNLKSKDKVFWTAAKSSNIFSTNSIKCK